MGDGRTLFFLLLFVAPPVRLAPPNNDKYYYTYTVPLQNWLKGDESKVPAYKHEMVLNGALSVPIRAGSNYSVHPTRSCDQKIAVVLQLEPPKPLQKKENLDVVHREKLMCTVSITIDDGHVEVWFGLCYTKQHQNKRRFHFPLNPMAIFYFTFDKRTMIVYKKEEEEEEAVEMGRVEHYLPSTAVPQFKEWETFQIFSYHDACPHITIKQVYDENDWRRSDDRIENDSLPGGVLLSRMCAIFSIPLAAAFLVLSLMHVWSMGVHFPSNAMFDAIFSHYNAKTGAIATPDKEEQKSCRSAEEPSEEWEGTGKKENLFCDKGRRKALVRPPPAYIIPDYDAPYEDDPEPVATMATAIEEVDAPALIPGGSNEKTPLIDPFAAEAAATADGGVAV